MSLQHLWPDIKAEIIADEMEALAKYFDVDPNVQWTGAEVAFLLRRRAKDAAQARVSTAPATRKEADSDLTT